MKERSAIVLASGRLVRWQTGGVAHVDFDGAWALKREETKGDVMGFFHTHPPGVPGMSGRDRRTMKAWAASFGKPLLCAIRCGGSMRVWICDAEGGAFEATGVAVLQDLFR
jgi:proteasome lid subunit RPN8/RPN11